MVRPKHIMKKEVLLAIVIGFGIGLLITFGIYTARTALQQKQAQTSPSPVAQTSPEPSAAATLTINEPKPDTLTDTDTVTVSGSAIAESTITITTQDSQKIVVADRLGKFSSSVELSGGANDIQITSFAPDGTKSETSITIVYSTAAIWKK